MNSQCTELLKFFFNVTFINSTCHIRHHTTIRGVVVIVVGNGHGDSSSNPGRVIAFHSTNTLGKGMNPIILPPAMGK